MFEVGDKVMLNPEVTRFEWGQGNVNYDEEGTITEINTEAIIVTVDFPCCHHWTGRARELVLARFQIPDEELERLEQEKEAKKRQVPIFTHITWA